MSNNLTPEQLERLALVMEECAEVQQVIGKILRHGYESHNPGHIVGRSNKQLLEMEIGDLSSVVRIMMLAGDISEEEVTKAQLYKDLRIKKYLHYNQPVPEHGEDTSS